MSVRLAGVGLTVLLVAASPASAAPDRKAPTRPGNFRVTAKTQTTVTVTRVTASQIDLVWNASSDDTGIRNYLVAASPHEGNLAFTGPTSATIVGLAPATTHTFTVKAQDPGYNFSPASAPASATTAASTDVTPPTPPADVFVSDQYCGEVRVSWTQSTDDQDPQSAIRYRIFINGVLDPLGTPIGVGRTITYGVDGENTFVVRAVDSAGNVSAPSNEFRITLDDCI